jgi:protein-S-isoprenylcysteine O-methyltransferase Ste14
MANFRTIAANLGLSAWLLIDAARSFISALEQQGLLQANSILLGATLTAAALFVLRRSAPTASLASPWRTGVIVASLILPFGYGLIWSIPDTMSLWLVALEWIATIALAWSILALRTNFSVLPQVRQLVDTGPYALVRHPIYASYLLLDLTYLIAAPTLIAGLIWTTEVILLYLRAVWEEDVWSASPEYQAYRARVRNRFVPGIV